MLGKDLHVDNKTYTIESELGHGSFGYVYRARDKATGHVIAVKTLSRFADDMATFAMQNEIGLAGKVRHQNVVSILAVNMDPEHQLGPYVAMEYVSEGTLKKKLKDARQALRLIPVDPATEIMLAVAEGARAINQFLIHRDIKPDNILFDGKTFKISDFGIAKIAGAGTRDQTFKGIQHPAYMAPENWLSEHNSNKLDIYSVGLVFYEILLLRHPLEGFLSDYDSHHEWEHAHMSKQCPDIRQMRPDVSDSWSRLLRAMTAKKPTSRPGWDEVIQTLQGKQQSQEKKYNLTGLLEATSAIRLVSDAEAGRYDESGKAAERKSEMISVSIEVITQDLDDVIEDLNDQLPTGKFTIQRAHERSKQLHTASSAPNAGSLAPSALLSSPSARCLPALPARCGQTAWRRPRPSCTTLRGSVFASVSVSLFSPVLPA